MQGWRKRMEDSHISDLSLNNDIKFNVFGVFDGHGGYKLFKLGKEVAIYVKKHFTEELLKNKAFKANNYKQSLVENFLKMDEIMVQTDGKIELKNENKKSKEDDERQSRNDTKNKQTESFKQMFDTKAQEDCDISMFTGCTACVVLIEGTKIYCANAGDSRAVLCKKGVAIPLSIDHKPDLDTEKNRIYKADGWVAEGRVKGINQLNSGNLNLSRSLGDLEYKQNKKLTAEEQMITAYPELIVENITSDCEFMVIGCDGIWDCKTNQEACDFVSERLKKNPNTKLTKIIEELLDEILATDIYNGN